jgi:DNA-binding beta-propeller fold protein YncE/streptogramin lyase
MGKVDHHLEVEILSALADGELDLFAARNAQTHLSACAECSARLASFSRLDQVLSAPAPMACASVLELRSALLDRELAGGEAAVAAAHLVSCETCRTEQAAWAIAETTLRQMPAALPSAAADARVARLTAPAAPPRLPLSSGGVSALALRGTVAATVVIAILIGLLPSSPGDERAEVPAEPQAIVAGVQQAVLYAATNTLYVLQPAEAAVDAMDASSYVLRARIAVGGRPTALALNEAASLVLVLDASQRSLVEIDAQRNEVVGTTQIPVSGTPTSVQVEAGSGRIVVSAIPDEPTGGAAPTPTVGARPAGGVVAVLDGATKKLQQTVPVEVAPRLVVSDPSGKQALLVSAGSTTLIDSSYRTVRTLPGGIAAAFGPGGKVIAVLADDAAGAALHLNGDGAPGPVRLQGAALAVASVPEVGFAVLLGSGSGNGRIVVVDEAGRVVGITEVSHVGRDLAYDQYAKRFTIIGAAKPVSAALPPGALALVGATDVERRTPAPSSAPDAPAASARPSTSASPSPLASPQQSASPVLAIAPASSPFVAAVPPTARRLSDSLYRVDLRGIRPMSVTSTLGRIWFVDQRGTLGSLDTRTGDVLTFDTFPETADIAAFTAGPRSVHAIDRFASRLYTFAFDGERLTSRHVPLLSSAAAMTQGLDGRLWIGLAGSGQILVHEPLLGRTETISTGLTAVRSIAFDDRGSLWFSDGLRMVGTYDPVTRLQTLFAVPGSGSAQHLLPDGSGRVWIGSSTGEISVIESGTVRLALNVRRPITSLALGPSGEAWFLAPAAPGLSGYVYGRVDGSVFEAIPGAGISLALSSAGRAWIADPAGGFYLGVETSR